MREESRGERVGESRIEEGGLGEAFAAWAPPNEVTTCENTPCKVAVRHLGGGPKNGGP